LLNGSRSALGPGFKDFLSAAVQTLVMNRNQRNASVQSGYGCNGRGPRQARDANARISGNAWWIRPFTILSLLVVIVACQAELADVGSTPPEAVLTTGSTTTAGSNVEQEEFSGSIAGSAPASGPRPATTGSYRQRYLSNVAPLIVYCITDLGWEATYDSRLGVLLPEVSLSQEKERDTAMSLCVAGSRTYHGIYAD
jgi:hypothetical protein